MRLSIVLLLVLILALMGCAAPTQISPVTVASATILPSPTATLSPTPTLTPEPTGEPGYSVRDGALIDPGGNVIEGVNGVAEVRTTDDGQVLALDGEGNAILVIKDGVNYEATQALEFQVMANKETKTALGMYGGGEFYPADNEGFIPAEGVLYQWRYSSLRKVGLAQDLPNNEQLLTVTNTDGYPDRVINRTTKQEPILNYDRFRAPEGVYLWRNNAWTLAEKAAPVSYSNFRDTAEVQALLKKKGYSFFETLYSEKGSPYVSVLGHLVGYQLVVGENSETRVTLYTVSEGRMIAMKPALLSETDANGLLSDQNYSIAAGGLGNEDIEHLRQILEQAVSTNNIISLGVISPSRDLCTLDLKTVKKAYEVCVTAAAQRVSAASLENDVLEAVLSDVPEDWAERLEALSGRLEGKYLISALIPPLGVTR